LPSNFTDILVAIIKLTTKSKVACKVYTFNNTFKSNTWVKIDIYLVKQFQTLTTRLVKNNEHMVEIIQFAAM